MTRLEAAVVCWEKYAQLHPPPLRHPYYPTEPAVSPLSAYAVTKEAKWRNMAVTQLDCAFAAEKDGLLLVATKEDPDKKYIHRDTQARQIYNYYLASVALGDSEYYRRATYCAEQMVRALPRQDHTVGNRTFNLFTAEFYDVVTLPRSLVKQPTLFAVDVNQNAEVGLMFALLAADPRPLPPFPELGAPLVTKSLCQKIAMRETMASMLLQRDATGEIPLNESRPEADTMYASYACFSWVWITMLDLFGPEYGDDFRYMKPEFASHIFNASNWLKTKMNLRKGRDDYQYGGGPGVAVSPSEYSWRLPLYWFSYARGVEAFIDDIFAYMANAIPEVPLNADDSFNAPWAYYIAMGIPLARLGV